MKTYMIANLLEKKIINYNLHVRNVHIFKTTFFFRVLSDNPIKLIHPDAFLNNTRLKRL